MYNYMENTWIDSLLWPPKVWSVFMQEVLKGKYYVKHSNDYIHSNMLQVRTTNDVKGWHTHLTNHAGLNISSKGLNLYILLKFLYEEAIQVDIYTKMLEQLVPKKTQLVPKRKDFLRNEKILNTRGDQAFYMGAENESAEKSAETGGHLTTLCDEEIEYTFGMKNASK